MSWSNEFLKTAIEEHCQKLSPPDLTDVIMQRAGSQERGNQERGSQERGTQEERADATRSATASAAIRASHPRGRLASAAIVVIATTVVVGVWQTASFDEAQGPQPWLPLQRGATWHYQVNGPDGEWHYTESVCGNVRRKGRDYHLLVVQRDGAESSNSERLVACDDQGVWQDVAWVREQLRSGSPAPTARRLVATPLRAHATWQWRHEGLEEVLTFQGAVVAEAESCTVPAGSFRAAHVRATTTRGSQVLVEDLWYARGIGLVRKITTRDGELVADAQLTDYGEGRPEWQPRLMLAEQIAKSGFHQLGMPDEVYVVPLGIEALHIDSAFVRVRHGTQWQLWRMTRERLVAFDPTNMQAWNDFIADERLFVPPKDQHQTVANQLCGVAGRLHAATAGYTVKSNPMATLWNAFEGQATVTMDSVLMLMRDKEAEIKTFHVEIKRGQVVKIGLK